MTGSPSAIISLGLGIWGSPGLVVTLGLGQGAVVVDPFYPSQLPTLDYYIPGFTTAQGFTPAAKQMQHYTPGMTTGEGYIP